jgi:hypothetical protein
MPVLENPVPVAIPVRLPCVGSPVSSCYGLLIRELKKKDTPILEGMQIYHNFIKPHEGLGGITPAEACGIVVNGENKWMTLIQNATRAK